MSSNPSSRSRRPLPPPLQASAVGNGLSRTSSSSRPERPFSAAETMAMVDLQQAQAVYLQQLQMQLQQQSAALLQKQQQESAAAFLAMQQQQAHVLLRQQQHQQQQQQQQASARLYRDPRRASRESSHSPLPHSAPPSGSFPTEAELEQSRLTNPLVASALARRKRQSLNSEALALAQQQGPRDPVHSSQRSTSTSSRAESSSSSQPPALILSEPGDPYPDSLGSGSHTAGVASGAAPNTALTSQSSRDTDSSPVSNVSSFDETQSSPEANQSDDNKVQRAARRRSHVSDLQLALGGRKSRPPVSGVADNTQSVSVPPSSQPDAPLSARTINGNNPGLGLSAVDLSPHVLSAVSLSPFASSFVPLPSSPVPAYVSTYDLASSPSLSSSNYVSTRPAPVSGSASATRQPRGPPSDLSGNFTGRIRRAAVTTLLESRLDRINLASGGGLDGAPSEPGVVLLSPGGQSVESEEDDDLIIVVDAPPAASG